MAISCFLLIVGRNIIGKFIFNRLVRNNIFLKLKTLNNLYLKKGNLKVELFGRGTAWLDTGTFESLNDASNYVRTIENRQNMKIGCPEEVAWRNKWINNKDLTILAENMIKSGYGQYLLDIQKDPFNKNLS